MKSPAYTAQSLGSGIHGRGLRFFAGFLLAFFLHPGSLQAAPSAVGKYGGVSGDGRTFVSFETTRRGFIRNLEIAGMTALCTTTLPGSPPLPLEERSTNITEEETPLVRLRGNGEFSDVFDLIDPARADFQGARVRISGSLRGNRGRLKIVLRMNETYEDGSTESCGGSVIIDVRRIRNR